MTHLLSCSYVMCGLYPLTTLFRPYTSHNMFITLSSRTILSCAQSCPTLCDPMNCSQLSSPVHESSQARILSGLLFPSAEDLPNPGTEPASPALAGRFFTSEAPEKPTIIVYIRSSDLSFTNFYLPHTPDSGNRLYTSVSMNLTFFLHSTYR